MHLYDAAEVTGRESSSQLDDRGVEPLDVPNREDTTGRIAEPLESDRFFKGRGYRLLHEHVASGRDRVFHDVVVRTRRDRDDNAVGLRALEEREMRDKARDTVPRGGDRRGLLVEIANADELDAGELTGDTRVALAHRANADYGKSRHRADSSAGIEFCVPQTAQVVFPDSVARRLPHRQTYPASRAGFPKTRA